MSDDSTNGVNVLIVEDEMILRMRAVDIVEDAGFCPVEAVNADEAISILESRDDISLLFTDIQMPGTMDGLKLAHIVHARWPAIKIILVSGRIRPADSEKPVDSLFFAKPLSVEQMISELKTIAGSDTTAKIPNAALLLADKIIQRRPLNETIGRSGQEAVLSAENNNLRLLLEQASLDAQLLLTQAGIEAEERNAADKLQQLIMGELHHRIKNTLATVSAIASQSFRTAISMEHGQKAMEGRMLALGRAHDLLMQFSLSNASLTQTLISATEPFNSQESGRFHFKGDDFQIASNAVIAFAMTFNELCTNTTKFGALSVPTGRVDVTWTTDKTRLQLTWAENGGPPVQPPTRRSFGTRMIESLGQQLNGRVNIAYEPDGFAYTLDVPLSAIAAAE